MKKMLPLLAAVGVMMSLVAAPSFAQHDKMGGKMGKMDKMGGKMGGKMDKSDAQKVMSGLSNNEKKFLKAKLDGMKPADKMAMMAKLNGMKTADKKAEVDKMMPKMHKMDKMGGKMKGK